MGVACVELGTSFARVAVLVGALPVTLEDPASQGPTPSVGFVSEGRVLVGQAALKAAEQAKKPVVRGLHRMVGFPVPATIEPAPTALAQAMFAHALGLASERLGSTPDHVILTVPLWFGGQQTEALTEAARSAGVAVERVVPDVLAASVSLVDPGTTNRRYLMVDAGGGGVSSAVVAFSSGVPSLLGSASDATMGAEDMDVALAGRALAAIEAEQGAKLADPLLFGALVALVSTLKTEVVGAGQAARRLPRFAWSKPGPTPLVTVREAEVEEALVPFGARLEKVIKRALASASIDASAIDGLLLAGGVMRLPSVRARVESLVGRKASNALSSSSPVALGGVMLSTNVASSMSPPARSSTLPPPLRTSTWPPPYPSTPPPARTSTLPPPNPSTAPGAPRTGQRPVESPEHRAALNLTSGRFTNPADARALMELPMERPLTAADVNPIALPVLLTRVLGRPEVAGTLTLTRGDERAVLPILDGRALLKRTELPIFRRVFLWTDGQFELVPDVPRMGDREENGMVPIAMDGMRSIARTFVEAALEEALGDRGELSPVIPPERQRRVHRLRLSAAESRALDMVFDGTRTARELASGSGFGKHTTLQLMVLLHAFGCLEWLVPKGVAKETPAEQLARRAERLPAMNHFDALGVHWSATTEQIEAAYAELSRELAPGGDDDREAPEACKAMRDRLRQVVDVVRDPRRRQRYRVTDLADLDLEATIDLLEKRIEALSLRTSDPVSMRDEAEARRILAEVEATQMLKPKPS
jgi:hypothetical protein